ncbi:MAG: YhbY family RNA-binding protein [Mariprofundus sp.]|nr:YhbY family RNA-binding protein [Mariprofundus sp.]
MSLNNKERKALKSRAHHLKPVIRVGQKGITESLIEETKLALDIHELIKVHIAGEDRKACQEQGSKLAEKSGAEMVHHIGKTSILYRKKEPSS